MKLLSNLCDSKLNHLINIVKINSLILNKKIIINMLYLTADSSSCHF